MREELERETLSPFATLAANSAGRPVSEEEDAIRTCFQRDRDRILHSKAFRRLKDKTQVFISPQSDHVRTRLTHSLEVAQIARTVGRALRLNEDLIEAIALGHDLGHTPFGHVGEAALDRAISQYREKNPGVEGPDRFRHHEQSLRIVDVLEGMNLSQETRLGIQGHSKGRADLSSFDGQPTSTLEAAVVRISDRIAYLNHDLDDALRSGIITEIPSMFSVLGASHGKRITFMVKDVLENSEGKPAILMSDSLLKLMNDLKEWLFENVYLKYPLLYPDIEKAEVLVEELFEHYISAESGLGLQEVVDYIAGMTDGFAIDAYANLKLPRRFARS